MANFLKGTWIGTHPGGGVHIQGFKEYKESVTKDAKGRRTHRRDKSPTSITVTMFRSEDPEEYLAFGTKHILELGDFVVQNNEDNKAILKHFVNRGEISLEDYELQCEMEGIEAEQDTFEEVDDEQEVSYSTPKNSIAAKEDRKQAKVDNLTKIREVKEAEKALEIAPFELITNVKRERESVMYGLIEKGIRTLDDLAEADIQVLTSIKHVGERLAEQMKQQASDLVGPKEQ